MSLLHILKTVCQHVSDGVHAIVKWICICLVIFMTAEVIVSVFFRYVLDSPLKWGEELARLTMVWAGLLGISIALRDGEHIGLEILTGRLHGRLRAFCNLITYCLVALFLVVLLIWGIKISYAAWGTILPALQIRWTWSHLAVPVTAAVQLLHLGPLILSAIMTISGREIMNNSE